MMLRAWTVRLVSELRMAEGIGEGREADCNRMDWTDWEAREEEQFGR